jgi:hypothetical protein
MIKFTWYSISLGADINTYRSPRGYANSDVIGLADDILGYQPGSCPLKGAKDALEDGSLWQHFDAQLLELLHDAITTYEKSTTIL